MDLVTCKCISCDAKLGIVANLWIQIGKRYLALIRNSEHQEALQVSTANVTRVGEANTVVGGCELQDAFCSACKATIGLKCLRSPPDHVLTSGQLILRTSSILLRSAADARRKAEPKIQRSIGLRGDVPVAAPEPSINPPEAGSSSASRGQGSNFHPGSSTNNFDIIQLQADLEAQRGEIVRIDSAGFQVVSTFQSAITRIEQQIRQLNDNIDSVRRDGDGQRDDLRSVKSAVSEIKRESKDNNIVARLEQQLQKTDETVAELRQGLADVKSVVKPLDDNTSTLTRDLQLLKEENEHLKAELRETTQVARDGLGTAKDYASEVTSLRQEVKHLRSELDRERSKPAGGSGSSFPSHEFEIITSNIAKIRNSASQVESLQMEFELFKSRVQRLETQQELESSRSDNHGRIDRFGTQNGGLSHQRHESSNHQKRNSSSRDDDSGYARTPSKRQAINSDHSSGAPVSYGSASRWEQSSPPVPAFPTDTEDSGPRLTKSGRIDKRTSRRGSSTSPNLTNDRNHRRK